MTGPSIRLATRADAAAVHAIYAPIVRDTAISFEWEPPPVDEVRARIERVQGEGYPWLVAELEGGLAGYAYATRFRTRAAYDWTAEVSIYVDAMRRGRGVGRVLYRALLDTLARQGFRSAYGVATAPNPGSEALHRALGFELVGRYPRVGWKFGAWHDVLVWHVALGPQDEPPGALGQTASVLDAWR